MMADIHLPLKPRSDIALLNGIAHILIRDGLINREYIDAPTEGFTNFASFVTDFTPEHTSRITGLGADRIEHVAEAS